MSSCIKDKITHAYKIYIPVYKSADLVRSEIRSEPARPVKNAGKIFVKGNYIFLNEQDKGVHIIDNTNPASPVNVSFINIAGNLDLAVKGDILYADLFTDLVAIDISNPLDAKVKKIIQNTFSERLYNNNTRIDPSRFVVDWIVRDTIIAVDQIVTRGPISMNCPNCSFSSLAEASGKSLTGVAGSMARFSIVNDNLYAVSTSSLKVYNILNLDDPKFVKSNAVGMNIETIFPMQDKLFMGSSAGVFIYDISSPENPQKISQFGHLTACDPVVADQKTAYVTLRSGVRCSNAGNQLDVLDVSKLESPVLHKTYPMENPKGLSLDKNLLFVCDDGLKVFNTDAPTNLKLIEHQTGFESYDVITLNNLAIVVTNDGIRQFSYNSKGNLSALSTTYWAH